MGRCSFQLHPLQICTYLSFEPGFSIFVRVSFKNELQNIITGNAAVRNGEIIQSVANYLRGKKKAVSEIEKAKFLKTGAEKLSELPVSAYTKGYIKIQKFLLRRPLFCALFAVIGMAAILKSVSAFIKH